jgi:hypothetical protein
MANERAVAAPEADKPYTAPQPDGGGSAPSLDPAKLVADRGYLFVWQEFTCGGFRHMPGQVLDSDVFRKYAPPYSENNRRESGFLRLIAGDEYDRTVAAWKQMFEPVAPTI